VEKLGRAQAAGPWSDALRKFVPDDEKLYTWWSYRSPEWSKADKGRRLDHVWVSAALADAVKSMHVLRDARGWERPSDHAPVNVELAL
jgi:exodeoxyribonuclease-3